MNFNLNQDVVEDLLMREIVNVGHTLPRRIVLVTDNGPAMKSRRYRNFIQETDLLIHIRGHKYPPQTIGRGGRFHGSLKLEWLYRFLPKNRQELVARVAEYRKFYNRERVHQNLDYRTPASVYLANIAVNSLGYHRKSGQWLSLQNRPQYKCSGQVFVLLRC